MIVDGVAAGDAATAAATLKALACRPAVIAVLFARLVEAPAGAEAGLFNADGTPKTDLAALQSAVATAQGATRGCSSASTAPAPAPATTPAPTTTTTTKPAITTPSTTTPAPATPAGTTPAAPTKPAKPVAVAAADQLVFPSRLTTASAPAVHLGCTAACLYLVTLQRASDGVPVLAQRGELAGAGARTVKLPKAPGAGSYRLSVWTVAQANPGPVSVARSGVVSAR